MQELELSDSFNAQMNEKMTHLLNYKLEDRKYTNLTPIDVDEDADFKSMVLQRKNINKHYLSKEKKDAKIFQPNLKDFWSEKVFVIEKPFTDFDIRFDDGCNLGENDVTQGNNDYLFYIYNKSDLGFADI